MIHEILPVGMLACNCSVFGDEQTREALVVDPGDETARILEVIAKHGLTVKAIVVTHAHIDHIGGAQKLKHATGAPVYMNLNDEALQDMMGVQAAWLGVETPEAVKIDAPAKEGDRLVIGATEFHVLDIPGVDSRRRETGGRRYALPRQHRPHRPARRRWTADPAVDPRQVAAAAGRNRGDPGTRRDYDDRAGEAAESVSAGDVEGPAQACDRITA
jgi:hypothetical protein